MHKFGSRASENCMICQALDMGETEPMFMHSHHIVELCHEKKHSLKPHQSSCHKWQSIICEFLTHWGRVTHICVGNLTIIGWDNGLSPGRRQAITWANVGILLTGSLGTNFSEMLIEIHTFSLKKIYLKMSSGKWRPFCLGLNVLNRWICTWGMW